MRFRRPLFVAPFVLLLAASLTQAAEPLLPSLPVIPRETGVLLLPSLDVTADSAHMQAPRQLVVRHRTEYEFLTRQFKVLGEALAAQAAKDAPPVDLADSSVRTAGNLDLLAKRAGADWVVCLLVQEAKLAPPTADGFTVHTRVLLQVWDARRHGWLANAPYTGQASGSGSPVFVFKNSLDQAVKGSFAGLLAAYPQTVTVSQEDDLNDYLDGQTAPFVGDPAKSFSGLKATP